MPKTFQKIWAAFLAVLAAGFAALSFVFARIAYVGFPNATGEPEGIALARLAMGLIAILFTVLTLLFFVMLVRGIKRLRHEEHA